MRELTLQELEEVAGGVEVSFNGLLTYIGGGLATVGMIALGFPGALAVLAGGAVVFIIENWEANIYYTGKQGGLFAPVFSCP